MESPELNRSSSHGINRDLDENAEGSTGSVIFISILSPVSRSIFARKIEEGLASNSAKCFVALLSFFSKIYLH